MPIHRTREDLERATALTRSFREQPTPELARSAQQGLPSAISANERMQYELHPWVSYVVLPLFALSNAGVHLTSALLAAAIASPITLGDRCRLCDRQARRDLRRFMGCLTALAARPKAAGQRPRAGRRGACAGIGFTVSLLISSLAFSGQRLSEAKLGALSTLVLAPLVSWAAIRVIRRIPANVRARQIGRTAADIPDLAEDVDPERDHVRGPDDAPVTLLEYGDFECPFCGRAEESIRELLVSAGSDVRYVWRHLPLNDVHPRAQLAAEASEAAAAQGRFWEMHDALLADQDGLRPSDLARLCLASLGSTSSGSTTTCTTIATPPACSADVASADESGVSGTPTFFINGRRHYGVYDLRALTEAVRAAKTRLAPRAPA